MHESRKKDILEKVAQKMRVRRLPSYYDPDTGQTTFTSPGGKTYQVASGFTDGVRRKFTTSTTLGRYAKGAYNYAKENPLDTALALSTFIPGVGMAGLGARAGFAAGRAGIGYLGTRFAGKGAQAAIRAAAPHLAKARTALSSVNPLNRGYLLGSTKVPKFSQLSTGKKALRAASATTGAGLMASSGKELVSGVKSYAPGGPKAPAAPKVSTSPPPAPISVPKAQPAQPAQSRGPRLSQRVARLRFDPTYRSMVSR